MMAMALDAFAYLDTPLGRVLVTRAAGALTGVYLETQANIPRVPRGSPRASPAIDAARWHLDRYFAGRATPFDVPEFALGTPFQRDVWRALSAIPFGETRSYEAIAACVGRPRAVRAVGAAVGRNTLAIVVPCHRVIAKNGALAGFAGGVDRKRWLLDHEAGARLAS